MFFSQGTLRGALGECAALFSAGDMPAFTAMLNKMFRWEAVHTRMKLGESKDVVTKGGVRANLDLILVRVSLVLLLTVRVYY